jgi:hypothetical protein
MKTKREADGSIVIDLLGDLSGEVVAVSEHEVERPSRMVRLITIADVAVPIIWSGPAFEDNDEGRRVTCRTCIVLMQKAPLPETMRVTIPIEHYDRLPFVSVEC